MTVSSGEAPPAGLGIGLGLDWSRMDSCETSVLASLATQLEAALGIVACHHDRRLGLGPG